MLISAKKKKKIIIIYNNVIDGVGTRDNRGK